MQKSVVASLKQQFPLIGLVLVVLVFSVATGGRLLGTISLQSLLNQVMATALVSIGAVFVFGSGSFDLSLSGCVAMSAVAAGYAAIASGSLILAFLAALGVSLLIGLLKGLFAAYVDVPLFIVTIVMGFMLSSLVLVVMGTETTLFLSDAVSEIPTPGFGALALVNAVILVGYFGVSVVVFNFTRFGKQLRLQGGNPVTARQSGVNSRAIKIGAFLFGAVGIALAAFVILLRTRAVGSTTAGSMGMDVLIALVLGGMPLSGGARSKVAAGLVGAATIAVINAGLVMMGTPLAIIQIIRGVLFLAVVYIASMAYRTKLLPR